MSDEKMKVKGFSKEDALVVRRILMIGSTEHGEHVGVEIETEDKQNRVLLVPFSQFQKFMLGLMTAGGIAHRDQVARFGSSSEALYSSGFCAFKPSGYDVGRLQLVDGDDLVLLRLKQGVLPIIDVRFSVDDASHVAQDIAREADKPAVRPRPRN